jgi:hypothetical protein
VLYSIEDRHVFGSADQGHARAHYSPSDPHAISQNSGSGGFSSKCPPKH